MNNIGSILYPPNELNCLRKLEISSKKLIKKPSHTNSMKFSIIQMQRNLLV